MGVSYQYFLYSSVFNAIVITFLGFLVFLKNRKDPVNRIFALFCLAIGEWAYTYILWPIATTAEATLLSFQLLHLGACFVSILYLHFVIRWLDLKNKFYRLILLVGYICSAYFALFTFSPAFISEMVPKFSMRFWAVPGMLYHYYLIMFFGFFIYSSYLLIKHYLKATGVKKVQIGVVLIGMVLTFLGGSTNYFLWYNINIPPYGNVLGASFVIFTAYAIVRYNLLNIKVIATESALLVMNFLLLFRAIVSSNNSDLIFNSIVLIGSFLLSILLLKSVKDEIKRREEVTDLVHSLEKANLRLQDLDRQKTEFLSIASHQLRTPLSIIKGYIELIHDGAYGKASRKLKNTLAKMDESNERLVKLVDEFLDVTRIEQGRTKFNFTENNICEIISSVVREIKEKMDENSVKVEWKPDHLKINLKLDEEKIRNVIFNFIDNAIKYGNGTKIKVLVNKENNGVNLRVQDNGMGFDKKDQASFFQKFYRGENVKGTNVTGTGLGLYVCRKFIETHSGQVWANSDGLGKGSEFGFWIPLKRKEDEIDIKGSKKLN